MIPRKVINVTVASWGVFVVAAAYWHVRYILGLNLPGPIEVEAHDPVFQVIAFVVRYAGRLMVLLGVALMTEIIIFSERAALARPTRIALGSAFVAAVAVGTYAAAAISKTHLAFGACKTLDTIECEDIAVDTAAAIALAVLAAAGFVLAIVVGRLSRRKPPDLAA